MGFNDRFSVQSAADANYLNIELTSDSQLDNIAIRMLEEDRPEFLLPLQIKTVNDRQSLRYKLVNAVSLSNSTDKAQMTKKAYLKLAVDLLTPFIKCHDWFLDYHYLCIDPRFILLDRRSDLYAFVYMPDASLRNEDEDILTFFESILNYIDITDDREYQIHIMHYFRDGVSTLGELYTMFTAEREKGSASIRSEAPSHHTQERAPTVPVAPPIAPKPVEPKNKAVSAPVAPEATAPKKSSFLGGLFGGKKTSDPVSESAHAPASDADIFGSDEAAMAALFGDGKKKKQPKPVKSQKQARHDKAAKASEPVKAEQPEASPVPVRPASVNPFPDYAPEEFGGGVTMIDEAPAEAVLELIDSHFERVPRQISLNFDKPYITMGRKTPDGVKLDVEFPEECKPISRQHARIAKRDGKYYVTDLGSTYFTLLDGTRLIPNMEYELADGMVLTLVEKRPIRYGVHLS